jgi:hypothetical protein
MKIRIKKKLKEMSSMGGGSAQGNGGVAPFNDNKTLRRFNKKQEEDQRLKEMFSSSGVMGMGYGRVPAERSPAGHKRYVRMRFRKQKLRNFKPNRYFAEENDKKSEKIKIKIKKH